jgi:hypothetical protein
MAPGATSSGLLQRRFAGLCVLTVAVIFGALDQVLKDRILRCPRERFEAPAPGDAGGRLARRVMLVVIDGLSLEGARRMPALSALRSRGRSYVAKTEASSYSMTGYAAIGTGSSPRLSGVSSNEARGPVRVDSIYGRSRAAGQTTAFVGYAWWAELFGEDLMLVACESGWGAGEDFFPEPGQEIALEPIPKGFERWVRDASGRYVRCLEDWRSFIRRHAITEVFGDDPSTSIDEEDLRGDEALRLWRGPSRPDFLTVHLQNPDGQGHRLGSADAPGYFEACRSSDRNLARLIEALDLRRDTLIVTADHGFTTTVVGAGHGGWEASSVEVPLVLAGAGVEYEPVLGRARQLDIAPTLSVLLGLAYPSASQGRPLLEALSLDEPMRAAAEARWRGQQRALVAARLAARGVVLSAGATLVEAEAQLALDSARAARARLAVRALLVLLGLGALMAALGGLSSASLARGARAWLAFEALFIGLHLVRLGPLSLSVVGGVSTIVLELGGMTVLALAGALALSPRRDVESLAQRCSATLKGIGVAAIAKALMVFLLIGRGPGESTPHGLLLYIGLVSYGQAFLLGLCAAPFMLRSGESQEPGADRLRAAA